MGVIDSRLQALADRLRTATGFAPVAPAHGELSGMSEAYAVQSWNRQRWIEAGREQTGYKVAFTTVESQQAFGTDEPVYGTLFADMRFENGSTLPAGKLAKPMLEGEIVMELGADLPGNSVDREKARAEIAAIYPALEIPDGVFNGKFDAVDMAASNASAAGYVLGPRFELADDFELAGIELEMRRNGEVIDSGISEICMGSPLNVLVWLAGKLAETGETLRAGQIVFAGSLIPIVPAQPGDAFDAIVSDLGSVSCRFPD
ncbi:MAG TPA: fumarylacetoacetate hydrolase family protein [Gammaproteobacteria bacterium]